MRFIKLNKLVRINPPQVLAVIFIFLVTIGGILLKLPISGEKAVSWSDAFFMAASAATVTGLTSVDPGSTFTMFGEIVILVLIQVGGLGIMIFAVLIMFMLGSRIGIRQRLIMQEALNQPSIGGIILLVKKIILFTLLLESLSIIFLTGRFLLTYDFKQALYLAIFHTVAAFNNAGFALWPDNLMRFVDDPIVNIIISLLIIVGGLGFTVIADLVNHSHFRNLSLHSKVMIITTAVINVVGFLFILLLEFNNPATLGGLDSTGKFWGAYFQAISTRTAGFNTIDITMIETPTSLIMIFLMFIGAGSTSTGGGIKLTTFVVIMAAVVTYLKGKEETNLFRRQIRGEVINRSLAIATISFVFVFLMSFILSITERTDFIKILFEVVSAFATVGLSMGLTMELTVIGKVIIILVMVLGKLGPLTIIYSLIVRKKANYSYPKGDIYTG